MTRRGREDWAAAPATKTSIADTVNSTRRIFWFLMGCDSFRFARLFSKLRPGEKQETVLRMPRHEGGFACPGRARERKAVSASLVALTAGLELSPKVEQPASLNPPRPGLKVQFQSELELPRVEGRSRPAVVMTIAGALIECVNVVDEP